MTEQAFEPAIEKYVSLATFRRSGVEVKTAVWMAPLGGRHYVFSAGDAGKVKRIRVTPRVRLAACDARGNVRGEWMEGVATVVTDAALIAQVRQAFREKYGLIMRLTDFMAALSGRLRRRAYIQIELKGGA